MCGVNNFNGDYSSYVGKYILHIILILKSSESEGLINLIDSNIMFVRF